MPPTSSRNWPGVDTYRGTPYLASPAEVNWLSCVVDPLGFANLINHFVRDKRSRITGQTGCLIGRLQQESDMRALILVAGAVLAVSACNDSSDRVVVPTKNETVTNETEQGRDRCGEPLSPGETGTPYDQPCK